MVTGKDRGIRYDARFLEEAVLLSVSGRPEESEFHAARDELYTLADSEERDRAFEQYHAAWFSRLRLGTAIERAFAEQSTISERVRACVIARAIGRKDEGAELFVGTHEDGLEERERRSVGLLLRPESLLDPEPLLIFLRHELLHISDMLCPEFQYEPTLPPAEGGPTHDRLLQDRYRLVWDTTIDGRMVRRGWAPISHRDQRWREFARTFSMLKEGSAERFRYFFDCEPHTHAELLAFACNPIGRSCGQAAIPHPGGRCPLCQFPTHTFEPYAAALTREVIVRINQDFPEWRPGRGLCPQCADLYRARVTR